MATLIPYLNPESIENTGERLFYQAAANLPDEYTVLYSFKYLIPESQYYPETIREADFVIIHPALGYLTVEVKQGEVIYNNRQWLRLINGMEVPLEKDPVEQARSAMFAILDCYEQAAKTAYFPLKKRYSVAFPQCTQFSGSLPLDLDKDSIFLQSDLENLEPKIQAIFNINQPEPNHAAVKTLLEVLAPTFKVFARLDEQIDHFNRQAQRLLTEEQERILDETELDREKIFFGSAGTGKTFLAMEKAKRLANQGLKVLLTCFNKNLAGYLRKEIDSPKITTANFHDFLFRTLQGQNPAFSVPDEPEAISEFFAITLPELAFDYFSSLPHQEKFDALIVDEGQDFEEEWYYCLRSMLKEDGYFYIFADPGQSIFGTDAAFLKKLPQSKHRLTQNLRNTETINNWLCQNFPQNTSLRTRLPGGLPVNVFCWQEPQEEKRLIEKEVGRLISQGIRPKRITILSPNSKEKSSLADTDFLKHWPIGTINDVNPHAIRYSTIRSFKGLEADIVFLIGLKEWNYACTPADIYVGASRARYLLYLFHHQDFSLKET